MARTNTQYGTAIRAHIIDDQSATGTSFLYLPVRFRDMSDDDIAEINNKAQTPERVHVIYRGRVGRADMIEMQ